MGKLEKIIELFRRKPPEVKFDEVCYLLEAFGFEEKRTKGSHHIFRHPDKRQITIPKKGGQKVKGIYVKKILNLLDLEDN